MQCNWHTCARPLEKRKFKVLEGRIYGTDMLSIIEWGFKRLVRWSLTFASSMSILRSSLKHPASVNQHTNLFALKILWNPHSSVFIRLSNSICFECGSRTSSHYQETLVWSRPTICCKWCLSNFVVAFTCLLQIEMSKYQRLAGWVKYVGISSSKCCRFAGVSTTTICIPYYSVRETGFNSWCRQTLEMLNW